MREALRVAQEDGIVFIDEASGGGFLGGLGVAGRTGAAGPGRAGRAPAPHPCGGRGGY